MARIWREREREQCIYEENERSKKIMEGDEGKYTSLRLLIEPGQEKRIIRALKSDRKGCVIYVRKIGKKNNANDDDTFLSSASIAGSDSKLDGNHPTRGVLHLTDRHLKKYHNADAGDRVGLNFDRRELEYNRKTGGFLPFLLPLLGAIAAGATTSLVDNALSKKKGSGVVLATSSSPTSSTQRPRDQKTIKQRRHRLYCGIRNIRRCRQEQQTTATINIIRSRKEENIRTYCVLDRTNTTAMDCDCLLGRQRVH